LANPSVHSTRAVLWLPALGMVWLPALTDSGTGPRPLLDLHLPKYGVGRSNWVTWLIIVACSP
jgi:hypothetical protein